MRDPTALPAALAGAPPAVADDRPAGALPADPAATASTARLSAEPAAPTGSFAAALNAAAPPATAAPAPADARLDAPPGTPAFATQLGTQVTTFVRDGLHHAVLELNPPDMGPVTVQIQLDGTTAQVHLAADHADTRLALTQAMPELAGSLREAGLMLAGGGVFEQPRQPASGGGDGDGRNGGRGRAGRAPPATDLLDGAGALAADRASTGLRRRGVVDLLA